MWRRLLAAFVVLAVVGGVVYAVYFSPALAVEGVEVSGTTSMTVKEVKEAAAVPTGGPLATADLVAIERRVASLAPVRSVDVTRKWPHDVQITVVERVPVAVVERGGVFRAVDSAGVVFNSYPRAPGDLPRIQTSDAADAEALREAVTVVAALSPELALVVDHVELISADEIELLLDDDREVRWGSSAESAQKSEVLAALLQQDARIYDVSVPGQPTTSGGPVPTS